MIMYGFVGKRTRKKTLRIGLILMGVLLLILVAPLSHAYASDDIPTPPSAPIEADNPYDGADPVGDGSGTDPIGDGSGSDPIGDGSGAGSSDDTSSTGPSDGGSEAGLNDESGPTPQVTEVEPIRQETETEPIPRMTEMVLTHRIMKMVPIRLVTIMEPTQQGMRVKVTNPGKVMIPRTSPVMVLVPVEMRILMKMKV
jgi:hypothetical protein